MELVDYSVNHPQFYRALPKILQRYVESHTSIKSVIDVGCGEGTVLLGMKSKLPSAKFTGVDLSPERLARLKERDITIHTQVADACELSQLYSQKHGFVISSQVIEHVPSDEKMLQEIFKITDKGGVLYVSSVIKKWYGWWIYSCNGKVTCDPTHVREYRSKKDFVKLIESNGFKVTEITSTPFMPSILNFVLSKMIRWNLLKSNSVDIAMQRHPKIFGTLQKIFRVWAPGYFIVEALAVKSK